MKPGWEVKPLGEVCRLELGSTPQRKNPKFWDDEKITRNVWLSIADMTAVNGKKIDDSKEYVSDIAAAKMKLVPEGTLILSFKLSLGRVAITGRDLRTNEAIVAIHDLDAKRVNREYLYWYFSFFDWNAAAANDEKLKGKTLNKAKLKVQPVIIPPLEEQKRIVAVLDAAFEGLTRAKENAETNLQNARELFESIARSVFGIGERDWPKATLPKVCSDFGRGKSRHRPRNEPSLYGGHYPFLQTGDLSQAGRTVSHSSQTYSEKGLAQSKLWPSGTVCIAIVGATIGESAITAMPACFPDSVIGMVPDQTKALSAYVQHLLEHYKDDLKAAGEGSARDNINLATFEDWAFPIPSVEHQSRVVEKLDQAAQSSGDLSAHYQSKLTDIADLRQSLLQKAFAGELT